LTGGCTQLTTYLVERLIKVGLNRRGQVGTCAYGVLARSGKEF